MMILDIVFFFFNFDVAFGDCPQCMSSTINISLCLVCCHSQVKWHEICLSIPAAILEVLNAWENGVLSVEAVQVRPKPNPPSQNPRKSSVFFRSQEIL